MNFVPAQSVYCNYWTRCQSSQQLRNRPFESCIDNAVNDYADTNLSYINTVIQCFITKTKRGKILYHCPLYEKKVQLMYCLLSMLFVNIPPPGPPTHYLTQIPPPAAACLGRRGGRLLQSRNLSQLIGFVFTEPEKLCIQYRRFFFIFKRSMDLICSFYYPTVRYL